MIFMLMFGILVISHELGHFLIGKKSGIRVKEFCIGMGPVLCKIHKGDTDYSIRMLPFGGACVFDGEDGVEAENGVEDPHLFQSVSVAVNRWINCLRLIIEQVLVFVYRSVFQHIDGFVKFR